MKHERKARNRLEGSRIINREGCPRITAYRLFDSAIDYTELIGDKWIVDRKNSVCHLIQNEVCF